MRDFSDVRYVWRHLPLSDVHVHAQPAAEAAEAAAAQDASWPMYDLLLTHQDALDHADLVGSAGRLGLDVERFAWLADLVGSAARLGMDVEGFAEDLDACLGAMRTVAEVESADRSTGTPTFFVNGRRHYGPYDIASLLAAVRAAEANGHLDSLEARKGTSPVAPMP